MPTQYTYSLQPIYVASLRKGLLATGKDAILMAEVIGTRAGFQKD